MIKLCECSDPLASCPDCRGVVTKRTEKLLRDEVERLRALLLDFRTNCRCLPGLMPRVDEALGPDSVCRICGDPNHMSIECLHDRLTFQKGMP